MRKLMLPKSLCGAAALGISLLPAGTSHAALVAYYPLDGNFNDVVGGFNGTGVNAPTFAASPKGQAVVLNGSNQYATLTTGNNLQLGGNFTVSAWANFDGLSADKSILGNDGPGQTNNTLHLISRDGGIHMGFYANDLGPKGTLTTGNWTHMAWQFDNGTMRTFINGAEVGSAGGKTPFAGTARDVLLGRWNGGRYMDGQIDDVAVYNTALAPADVAHLAAGGSALKLLTDYVAPQPTGWISETFRRTGNATISNLADADDAINNGVSQGSGVFNTVNFLNSSSDGNFGGGVQPPGLVGATDDFTVKSTGFLQVGLDGNYVFRNNTDDGSRLRLDLNQNGTFEVGETIILDDVLSGTHNADSGLIGLLAGKQYMIEHVWFERSGGAAGELAISRNGSAFFLFGDPEAGGDAAFNNVGVYVTQTQIPILPEPATLSLLGLAGLGMMRRCRRMA